MDREIKPGLYRHFKGKLYRVIGIGLHSETKEPMVVYESVSEHHDNLWCRPLEMFASEVDREKYPDCQQKYRFEAVEE